MIKQCHKCKTCHKDLDIEKALGIFQMWLMSEMDKCNNEDAGEICMLYRKAMSFDLIVKTLKENGLCK